jgi:hypothetical protein
VKGLLPGKAPARGIPPRELPDFRTKKPAEFNRSLANLIPDGVVQAARSSRRLHGFGFERLVAMFVWVMNQPRDDHEEAE